MSSQKIDKRQKARRLFGLGLVLVFIVTVTLALSLTVRITRGVSRTVQTPEHSIRLEVLNGCAKAGIATEAAGYLKDYKDENIEIAIIRIGDFDLTKVARTLLIARDKDKAAAKHLARVLGIDESEVVYRPMENNYQQVSVTLVIGEDYVPRPLAEISYKE